MKKFNGFTLTELMIALAVIGILLAVVTPAIVRTRPNRNKMMVKKSFYTLEQTISSMINDELLYPDKTDMCVKDAAGNMPYQDQCAYGFDDITKVNYNGTEYEGDNKFANIFKDKLNVKSTLDTYKFTTSDGITWDLSDTVGKWTSGKDRVGTFDDQDSNTAGLGTIVIDVDDDKDNGECTNDDCDRYTVQILANGKLKIVENRAARWATIQTSIKD